MTNMNCMCVNQSSDPAALQRNKEITKKLLEWQKEEQRVVKLLLLGTGESGKSTVTKQMKIIHINGYTDSERRERIPDIRKNLKDSILTVCGAMNNLGIPLSNPDLQDSMQYVMDSHSDTTYTQEFYKHTDLLWHDEGVQQCYKRSHEYQLIDCAKYFLDRNPVLRKEDYLPTDQDILRCRVMTNTILQIDFVVHDRDGHVPFRVFDVGGQRGERRKWIQVFDGASAILFVLDCSSFDNALREDQVKNRLLEAAEIFEQVWNSRYLRDVSIILFINKIDLLEEKINAGKSLDMLLDTMADSDPYYHLFQEFKTYGKPTKDEKREFLDQFPFHTPGSEPPDSGTGNLMKRRKSKQTNLLQREVNEEVIRTAVFIKNVFVKLLLNPIKYQHNSNWHENHTCEYFYTCAVDTHTISKVWEGSQSIILKKHLQQIGINLY